MIKFMKFFAREEFLDLGRPEPMKGLVPEWYKKAELTYMSDHGEEAAGLKKCVPVLDALISGYALTAPCDFYISEKEDGTLDIRWDGPESFATFIMERPKELGATMPRPEGHHENHLVWSGVWAMETPRGYSLLVTHPLNRFDLPFTTYSGIMDSDKFISNGNIPFFIKKGFTGVIPKGTPIAQLIPIKRKRWRMIIDKGMQNKDLFNSILVRKEETTYKRIMWQKKEYN